ncbi:hypothetical protein EIP91_001745 [Steccherinum ochraceum]|uniref:Uncharacterized protein n=1 Tax=Steccherinum ochraceum TaxID=92696 RepID=A0A4R0RFV1_9APHY|nr:hypothetical protein EIP91_001745 [Steccherinum ochraceum]
MQRIKLSAFSVLVGLRQLITSPLDVHSRTSDDTTRCSTSSYNLSGLSKEKDPIVARGSADGDGCNEALLGQEIHSSVYLSAPSSSAGQEDFVALDIHSASASHGEQTCTPSSSLPPTRSAPLSESRENAFGESTVGWEQVVIYEIVMSRVFAACRTLQNVGSRYSNT